MFAKAREKARQSSCSSNSKQMMLAVLQYAQDYDEMLPRHCFQPGTNYCWFAAIAPYCKNTQMFKCPSMTVTTGTYGNGCYTYNLTTVNGVGTTGCTNRAIGAIPAPSGLLAIAETNDQTIWAGYWNVADPPAGAPSHVANGTTATGPHNEGSNIAYVDGHTKWQKQTYIATTLGLWDSRYTQ